MKTFKWTVPEPLPSKVEELASRKKAGIDPNLPTKSELKEFEGWEKIRKRGLQDFLIRSGIGICVSISVLWCLNGFDIFTGIVTLNAVFGAVIGSILGPYISWKSYQKKKHKIREYLNKCEQDI